MNTPQRIALIGVPSSAGARMAGQEQAPRCLREAGLVRNLVDCGFDVNDMGDLAEVTFTPDPGNPRTQNLPRVLAVLREVSRCVRSACDSGCWPLVIGGDCSITIGVLAALIERYPDLGLAYLDGDVDLNTPGTTPSGIFDGMVMAHILGRGAEELRTFSGRSPMIGEEKISLFGYSVQAGGIDPVEIDLLKETRMACYPFEHVTEQVAGAAESAVAGLERQASRFLVHFDVDVVEFDDFPAVDVPHRPGLTLAQAGEALGIFTGTQSAVGLVVTEFNARLDTDGMLAERLVSTIGRAMAARLSPAAQRRAGIVSGCS